MTEQRCVEDVFSAHSGPPFGPERVNWKGCRGVWVIKMAQVGLKIGKKHVSEHPKWPKGIIAKHGFDLLLKCQQNIIIPMQSPWVGLHVRVHCKLVVMRCCLGTIV